jgi:hypothetical protein
MNAVTITRAGRGEYYVSCDCGYITRRKGRGARDSAREAVKDHKADCQDNSAPHGSADVV